MRVGWLILALAGCAEPRAVSTGALQRVALTGVEPRAACTRLDAVEVRAAPNECSATARLREYARERGANLVVLDSFAVRGALEDAEVIVRARLFGCPGEGALP